MTCHSQFRHPSLSKRHRRNGINADTDTRIATSELVAAHLDRGRRKACPLPDRVAQTVKALGW